MALIKLAVLLVIVGNVLCDTSIIDSRNDVSGTRKGKFFPFYTIGRFANSQCDASNSLTGTCVLNGECSDAGGLASGSCSTVTSQATCCVYQQSCGTSSSFNNTYFYNSGYPSTYAGGSKCGITITPYNTAICQLRIDFLVFSLAQPNGDGVCVTDYMSITGGSSRVPRICGENTGSHVYINFNGASSISIVFETTASVTFNRQWQLQITQLQCDSVALAPSGCLQYYMEDTGVVTSFNYAPAANSNLNSAGVLGSRQLANTQYGICVRMAANQCSITWSQTDTYGFTLTGDLDGVDPTLIGDPSLQEQDCSTDYVIIPYPSQNGALLTSSSDRFCGMGIDVTTSSIRPFALYVVTDGNEDPDIGNRGFSLAYSQNACPIV